jgi:hypothetical protein
VSAICPLLIPFNNLNIENTGYIDIVICIVEESQQNIYIQICALLND